MSGQLSGMADRWGAHPFQQGISTLANSVLPGAGYLTNLGFSRYNQGQFNDAAQQSYQHGAQQGNQAASEAFGAPLSGVLGSFGDPSGSYGPATGWNMSQSFGMPQAGSSGLLDFLGGQAPGLDSGTWQGGANFTPPVSAAQAPAWNGSIGAGLPGGQGWQLGNAGQIMGLLGGAGGGGRRGRNFGGATIF